MPLVTRFLHFDDLRPGQDWQLLDWCMARGADEFTIAGLTTGPESERMRTFFAGLEPWALAAAPRRTLAAPEAVVGPRWMLRPETRGLLYTAMPDGFATRTFDPELWLEDLTVYREGDFMLGVLSHEQGGALRVTELELPDVRRLGIPDRDTHPWVGY